MTPGSPPGAPDGDDAAAPQPAVPDPREPPASDAGEATGRAVRRLRPLTVVTIAFGVGAVLMGALAVVLLTRDEPDPPVTIRGTVAVIDEGYAGERGDCAAEVGSGAMAGTAVFVVDADGAQLGTGTVGDGRRAALFECRFDYEVADVEPAPAYTVVLGDTGVSRTVTATQLEADGGVVDLSVGGLSG